MKTTSFSNPPSTQQMIRELAEFEGPPEDFLKRLLAFQCRIAGAEHGALFKVQRDQTVAAVAIHPPFDPKTEPTPAWFAQATQRARAGMPEQPEIDPLQSPNQMYGAEPSGYLIGLPISGIAGTHGYAAFEIPSSNRARCEQALQRLELTSGLLGLYEARLSMQRREEAMKRLRQACTVLSELNTHHRFKAAAMEMCNQITATWSADRVSLGLIRGRYIKLQATSHTEKFVRKTELLQAVESAMEECVDQNVEVPWPISPQSTTIARAAEELGRRDAQTTVLSLPIRHSGQPVGAITIERASNQPFTLEEVEGLRLTCDLGTARLVELSERDRWFGARWLATTQKIASKAFGPTHTLAKVASLALMGGILAICFVQGPYRVEAPFVVEAAKMQKLTAAVEGKLLKVHVEPGDRVVAGETVLADLDTSELRGRLAIALSDIQANLTEKKIAERENRIADAQIAEAKTEQARAQVQLLQFQIDQASIRSSISGIVLTGDLKDQIGALVRPGQILFEVAPLENLRARLAIKESDVQDVIEKMSEPQKVQGQLATLSYPGDYLPFEIERLSAVAEMDRQSNVFHAHVKLNETRPWLRPRMEGVAKIDIDRRPYAAIWTRDLIAWVRMKLWI